jgi:uncharacterized protein YceH (UPF0502 family)
MEKSGFGSRVVKYQHRFCNTEFGPLKFTPQELAIICELLLRGPQTPGELRSRASRMAAFGDVTEVESALDRLASRDDGPFVVKLAREPGRRESRYAHLFSGMVAGVAAGHEHASHAAPTASGDSPEVAGHAAPVFAATPRTAAPTDSALVARVERLETEVAELRAAIAALRGTSSS